MNDDPLDRLTPPLDDERFTRAVLRRARVPAIARTWRRAATVAAAAGALAVIAALAGGPLALMLCAVGSLSWALTMLGDR
jgi:hypothetical protein